MAVPDREPETLEHGEERERERERERKAVPTFKISVYLPLIGSRKSGRYSRSDQSTDSISPSKSLCLMVQHRVGNADAFRS